MKIFVDIGSVRVFHGDLGLARLAGGRSGQQRKQAGGQDGGAAAGGRGAHQDGEDMVPAHGF